MYSNDQFTALEIMCRERAALAKQEMEYRLAEAKEWKQLREYPEPIIEIIASRSSDIAKTNNLE
jgi:hypothetical protein